MACRVTARRAPPCSRRDGAAAAEPPRPPAVAPERREAGHREPAQAAQRRGPAATAEGSATPHRATRRPRRAPRNERLRPLHPAADRDLAAGRRRAARRRARLLLAAGLVAAAGRFPDHPGDDAAARAPTPTPWPRWSPRRWSASSARSRRSPRMTSSSSFGISQITLQFDLDRDIDAAAQDVQAAINAAGSTLPRNLPYPPTYAKVNPADAPIVTLALTSRHHVAARAHRPRRHADGAAPERGGRRRARLDRRAASARPCASRPTWRGSPPTASRWRTCAPRSPPPTSPAPRARSTARTSPTPSPPTTRSPPPTPTARSSSPTATARRCCSATSPRSIDGLENDQGRRLVQGQAGRHLDIHRQPGANIIETVERIQPELPRLRAPCRAA